MDKCRVYELTFSNGKGYVGVTHDMKERIRSHRKGNSIVGRAFRKYGRPDIRILLIGKREYCYEMERSLIEQRQTLYPLGYNLLTGGHGNTKHNTASRIKMANSRRGAKHTEETKRKLAISASRENMSPENRRKKSEANRCRIVSSETRAKMSVSGRRAWIKRHKVNG